MKTSRFDAIARQWTQQVCAMDPGIRADAAGVFFTRQLEDIEADIKDTKYAALKSLEMVSLLPGLDPLAERHTYRMRDWVGKAKRSAHPTDSAPTVNTLRKELSTDYFIYKSGFEYSLDELRKSAAYGLNLDRERSVAARLALAQQLDDLMAVGDSEVSMTGLLTLSGVQTYSVPSTGTGSSPLWVNKTPDQILADLNGIVTQVLTTTLEIESVKRIVLPTNNYRLAQATARSTNSDLSILEYFKRNNPGVEVLSWERLQDATSNGTGGTGNRILAGDFSALNVRGLVPVELEMLEPERQGEGYKVALRMKVGGVESVFPKAICYADGT
jgi:hypothetical protein